MVQPRLFSMSVQLSDATNAIMEKDTPEKFKTSAQVKILHKFCLMPKNVE